MGELDDGLFGKSKEKDIEGEACGKGMKKAIGVE